MRVILSAADSATLKQIDLSRRVDTSREDSEKPSSEVLIAAGPDPGPKKKQAITHILTEPRLVVARNNGNVESEGQVIAHLDGIIGLGAVGDTIVIFGAGGHALAVGADVRKFRYRDGSLVVTQKPNSSSFCTSAPELLPEIASLDMETLDWTVEWTAAEPPLDRLDLPERNDVSAMVFTNPEQLVAVSSSGRLRVYDLPGCDPSIVHIGPPIKSVAADPLRPQTVIIGDSRSGVSRWSTTRPPKLLGKFGGIRGSTRALSIYGDYVAIGGLGRYLRVYHTETRTPAGKVYIGEEIWALKLIDDAEEDTLWSGLEKASAGGKRAADVGADAKRVKQGDPDSESEQDPSADESDS